MSSEWKWVSESEESRVPEGAWTQPLRGTLYKAFTSLRLPAKGYELPKGKSLDQIRTNYFFTFLLWKTALPLDLCWPSGDQVDVFVEPTQVKASRCQARSHYFCIVDTLCCSESRSNIVENTTHVSLVVDAWHVAQTSGWCTHRLLW